VSPPLAHAIDMNRVLNLALVFVVLASLWLAALVGFIITSDSEPAQGGLLRTFDSRLELVEFLKDSRDSQYSTLLGRYSAGSSEEAMDAGGALPHSSTNVQTVGVDEADMVKTDGEYIYVASSTGVKIVRAVPAEEMEVVSVLETVDILGLDDSTYGYVDGLFVLGDSLVVLGCTYYYAVIYDSVLGGYTREYEPPRTSVSVFDIGNRSNPELELTVGMSGSFATARMVNGFVYVLSQLSVWFVDEDNMVPRIWEDGDGREVSLSSVRYDPEMRYADSYVNILALELSSGDHASLSVVSDWSSTIYMSTEALYFAVQKWEGDISYDAEVFAPVRTNTARTTIYRIATDGLAMTASARGDVDGWLLNQFSMDEHEGNLRVATTTGWTDAENAVYVLNGTLHTIGVLEGLAPTERIYSARFVQDTLYLVTFRQIDPLFVIDLSNPEKPKVSGELKIPGFSNYLHPVDESHVLGIGQENWTVKISLFDVSDPTAPFEESKYLIEGLHTSAALYDHKAVLFDLERELLVIPGYESGVVSDSEWNYSYYTNPVAYVLRVSLTEGISLRGIISHDAESDYWYGYMERSLYIGDRLYTLSNLALQANALSDLSTISKVILDDDIGVYGYHSL